MAKLLLEDAYQFIPDRAKIEEKQISPGRCVKVVPGRFSLCDEKNGNNRLYPRKVWQSNLKEDSLLMQRVRRNAAFGTLEHPSENDKIDLKSPIAVMVTEVKFHEKNTNEIWGNLLILNTPEGQKLNALVEAGYNPYVSSRGYGSLNRRSDGVDEVCEDYICEGWDIVYDPSFSKAELYPARETSTPESVQRHPQSFAIPAKEAAATSTATTVAESISGSGPTPAAAKTAAIKKPTMKDLKDSIQRIRAVDASKLTPAEFVRGMSEMQDLHRQASQYLVENTGQSWEVTKLHEEIQGLEQAWCDAATAPARELAKVRESNKNLIQLVEKITNAARSYRDEAGSTRTRANKRAKVIEALATAGRGLRTKYEAAVSRASILEKKYAFSTECLDYGAKKYQTDTTRLGRAYIQEKFSEEPKTRPALAKRLNEAKKPSELAKIKEALSQPESEAPINPPTAAPKSGEKAGAPRTTKTPVMVENAGDKPFAAMSLTASTSPQTVNEVRDVCRRQGQKSIFG